MNLKPFTGPGSTPSRRRFWDQVTEAVNASTKVAGRHVTVSEHPGKGTVINVDDTSARRPTGPATPTGACCRGTDCTIETQASCESDGGVYQGDGTVCDPNPCGAPCTFEDLPTHVTGTLDFTATITCDDSTVCNIVGHYDFNDDLVSHLGTSRRFLGLGVGTATYDCGEPSTCIIPATLEIEVYVQCVDDDFTIHLFTQTNGVSCCATAGFAYNNGDNTIYMPPATAETFGLDLVAGTGTGSGTMVLTLT